MTMKKLISSRPGDPTPGSTAQLNLDTTATPVNSAAVTNQTPQGTLRSTTHQDHLVKTNRISHLINYIDRIVMAPLLDNKGIHQITQIATIQIEITSQVTTKEDRMDTMSATTKEDTILATIKGCKAKAVTTQDTTRVGDTSTNIGIPEVTPRKTSGLNL